jgi:dTMP kinase
MDDQRMARFITLEGGDGVGKTTQARFLANVLASIGVPVVRTREPGGAPGAEAIRRLILSPEPWDPITDLLLHFAARREHVERTIKPALHAGLWVVCDRFLDSTFAYQGAGQGTSPFAIQRLADVALGCLRPDLTIILDADPRIGLQRVQARGPTTRYEDADFGFHHRVRAEFLHVASREPERCAVIDASGDPRQVAASVMRVVADHLSHAWPEVCQALAA